MTVSSAAAAPAMRPDEGAVPPRFVSLDSNKVYMREGPTYDHRVLWVYRRKGLPVLLTAQFDVWRRVQDSDGTVGWVHSTMISDARTVLVTSKTPAALRSAEQPNSNILALAQPGVIAKLETCGPTACQVSTGSVEGWIDKKNIWGVRAGDVFH
ncbi:MAG: SH3 domain-containing protein [Rhizomicrobium sp.]